MGGKKSGGRIKETGGRSIGPVNCHWLEPGVMGAIPIYCRGEKYHRGDENLANGPECPVARQLSGHRIYEVIQDQNYVPCPAVMQLAERVRQKEIDEASEPGFCRFVANETVTMDCDKKITELRPGETVTGECLLARCRSQGNVLFGWKVTDMTLHPCALTKKFLFEKGLKVK